MNQELRTRNEGQSAYFKPRLLALLTCFLAITLCSCSVKDSDLVGNYQPNYLRESEIIQKKRRSNIDLTGTKESLEIRGDGTFTHEFSSPKLGNFSYEGTWSLRKDNFHLRPYVLFNPHDNSIEKQDGIAWVVHKDLGVSPFLWIDIDRGYIYEKIK